MAGEQHLAAASIWCTEDGGKIVTRRTAAHIDAGKLAADVAQHGQRAAASGREHEIFAAVALYIDPAHAGPELAHPAGKQRLATEIGEQRVGMRRASKERSDVFEQRWRRKRLYCGHGFYCAGLVNLIQAVRLRANCAAAPRAPANFDGRRRVFARGKCELRVTPGEVVSAGRHLARLCRQRCRTHRDHCANALRIWCGAAKTNRNTRRGGFVAIHNGRRVETSHHDVERSVAT